MKITIETIDHDKQRYPTVGDWFFEDSGDLTIRVSNLGDWKKEALVAVHELSEALMCKHGGVHQERVDLFDTVFEANRVPDNEDEPGDDSRAPYVRQHCVATGIERILCAELDVNWKEYEEAIYKLP